MNAYEAKQEARKMRFFALSEAAAAASDAAFARARSMASAIPMGQPILVGHHSEGRDRAYRDRIWRTAGRAVALSEKAEHYASRAASVGHGGISSDDPDAIQKLKAKLEGLVADQERMKSANKTKRGSYPSWQLSNNNAEISRVKKRIAELEAAKSAEAQEVTGDGWRCVVDPSEELRVNFFFDGKPSEEVRSILKSNGFKWSPSRMAWTRKATGWGNHAAGSVIEKLRAMEVSNA